MKKTRIALFLLLATLAVLPLLTGCSTTKAASAPVTVTVKDTPAASRTVAATGDEFELKRESLRAGTRTEPAGEVVLRKVVEAHDETIAVTLGHDDYEVVRTAVSGAPTTPFADGAIALKLNRDVANAVIAAEAYERVSLRPVRVQTTTNITGTVRSERIVTERVQP